MTHELKIIKQKYDKGDFSKFITEIKVKSLFLRMFLKIFNEYINYLNVIDDYAVFNINSFLLKRPKADENFYKELVETQMFQVFSQSSLKEKNEDFFNSIIKQYNTLILEKNFKGIIENSLMKLLRINTSYLINPYFSKYEPKYDKIEKKIIDYLGDFPEEDIKNTKYFYYNIPNVPLETKYIEKKKSNIIAVKTNLFEKAAKKNILVNRLLVKGKRSDWVLTEDEKDDIKYNIKEILSKAFKSEKLNFDKDLKQLLRSIDNPFGREFFINSVYQKKAAEKSIKTISEDCFKFLYEVIYNALLEIVKLDENTENVLSAVYLVRSTRLYCKTHKKKTIFISDEMFRKLKDFPLLTQEKFWEKWVETDLSEDQTLKDKKKTTEEMNQAIINSISKTCETMCQIRLGKGLIFNIMLSVVYYKIKKGNYFNLGKAEIEKVLKFKDN